MREFPHYAKDVFIEKDKLIMFGLEEVPPIYIWDLRANKVHEVGSFRDVSLWHMDVDKNILVIFQIDWDRNLPEVQQTKRTLTGELLDRKHFHLPLSGDWPEGMRFIPARESRRRTFGQKTRTRLFSEIDENGLIDLIYDYTLDKLSARWGASEFSKSIRNFGLYQILTPYIAYQWNITQRQIEITDVANNTATLHPYQPEVREMGTRRTLWHWKRLGYRPELIYIILFGNCEVFGLLGYDGIQLWFFNPNFVPDIPDTGHFVPVEESG